MANKKVLFLVNHELVIYNFRKELVTELLNNGYEVYISSPGGEKIDKLIHLGAMHIETNIDRHGINIFQDLRLIRHYSKIIKKLQPLVVLTYTIKPNVYGGFAAKKNKIPYIANITGLGTGLENRSILKLLIIILYRLSFSNINTVFFQNSTNLEFFKKNKISENNNVLLPGSGVNLDDFSYQTYPNSQIIHFAFISRIMKEKGIDLYLYAAKEIKRKHKNTVFHVCGFCEQEYEDILKSLSDKGIIIYHGMIDNVKQMLTSIHCLIHPTFYPEGMSNILLETAAIGRPIITTNRPGTKEIVNDSITGFLLEELSGDSLVKKIEMFLRLKNEEKIELGVQGNKKVTNEFNRKIVIDNYIGKIKEIECDKK